MLAASKAEQPATFAAVRITELPEQQPVVYRASPPLPPEQRVPGGQIEIELVGGRRIRIGHDVDIDILRRLTVALETSA